MKNYITVDGTIGLPSHTAQNPTPATSFASLLASVAPKETDEATLQAHLEEQARAYDEEYELAIEGALMHQLPWFRYD